MRIYRWPHNPARIRRRRRFGLVPFRSPLLRESRLLSFPRATEMFHFARFAFAPYIPLESGPSGANDAASAASGYPIRKSRDLGLLSGSSGLIAAIHVLHRLLTPKHPPCTLGSMTLNSPLPRLSWWYPPLTPILFTCQRAKLYSSLAAALSTHDPQQRRSRPASSVPRCRRQCALPSPGASVSVNPGGDDRA